MNKRRITTWIVVLILAGWASTTVFTVDATQMVVVTWFGKPHDRVRKPGLNFKMPWPIDAIIRIDSRILYTEMEPQELLTRDQKNVLLQSFFLWRIVDPIQYARTVKTRAVAEARLNDLATARLGAAVGEQPMETFFNLKSGAADSGRFNFVALRVRKQVSELSTKHFGIEFLDLRLNGFGLPPQNRASVIGRMQAERQKIAAAFRSEGEEMALKIEAEAEAEHERILGKAHGEAEAIRGAGEAKALKIYSRAYAKDPEFYRFIRSLQSYEAIINKKATLFLESDSKLLRILNGKP